MIHFNCGLHDIRVDRQLGTRQAPLPRYQENLRAICVRLQATGAKLIWATTTPVIFERHGLVKDTDRREEDVSAYNRMAVEVIRDFDISVNDLHLVAVAGGVERLLLNDGLHFTEAGIQLLANAVAKAVSAKF